MDGWTDGMGWVAWIGMVWIGLDWIGRIGWGWIGLDGWDEWD